MNDNVTPLFKTKAPVTKETMEETVLHFHTKLDSVMNDFHSLSVMEKFSLTESLVTMNKTIFELLMKEKEKNRV